MTLKSERLKGPDGLRGFAALWVVLYHLWSALQRRDTDWVWGYVSDFFEYGFLGVDIFFVLSGFVIAYSLTGRFIDNLFVPRFLVRRSIRIDPPYWLTIVLALIFIGMKNIVFQEYAEPLPSFENIFVHVLYLQDLLGYEAISSVFWTLCLEFQFYIIFSTLLWLFFKGKNALLGNINGFVFVSVLCFVFLSVFFRFSSLSFPVSGTIIPYAYEFSLGIIACQYITGRAHINQLVVVCLIAFFCSYFYKGAIFAVVPIFAVVLMVGSAVGGKFFSFLNCRALQYLGRISYSLYLTHAIVGWATISFLVKIFSNWPSPFITVLIFLSGFSVSIIFANIFYVAVEKYFIGLSKKISRARVVNVRI
ncbi:acyltransferase [Marinobacter sp.]|uniref:acyltransferase family protein n=1 Tax=Marinobacter sp. TaxID=50741 RepID=UPI002B27A9C9|nr:acyltransferase [Marinobacter sp.]